MGHTTISDRPDDVHALGRFIAQQRQRLGLTRAELAGKVREEAGPGNLTTDRAVERWELRGVIPQAPTLRAIAAALEQPVERLTALVGKLHGEEEQETDRREFGKRTALALVPGVIDWGRILAATKRGRTADARTMDELAAITASFGRLWKVLAPGDLLPGVHAHLSLLRQLSESQRPILAMTADVATLAGYLAFQAEDRGHAMRYWALARDLATDVGGETQARALVAVSAIHSTVADGGVQAPSRAPLALLNAAQASAPSASRLLRGWVLARRAEEHAALGEGSAADADLAAADAALRESEPCSDSIIGPSEASHLDGFRGSCAVLLGRYTVAAEILGRSLSTMPPGMTAWRSVVSADLGAALAGMGETDGAATALMLALDLATEAAAPEHTRRVRGIRQRYLPNDSNQPTVRRLDERLIATV